MTSIKLRLFTFEDNLHHAKPSNERTLLQNLVCYCISKNVVIELWIFMWKAKPGEKHLSLFLSSLYLLQGSSEAVLGTDQVSFFPVLLP